MDDLPCQACGHDVGDHKPDMGSGLLQKCTKCFCTGYFYPEKGKIITCHCGHVLEDHVKFEEIKADTELQHKCHGETSDGSPCSCSSLRLKSS